MSFVFSIRNRERSKVKKGSKNYSLLPQKENGRNAILEVNVRYIRPGELDHVLQYTSIFQYCSIYLTQYQTVYQITCDIIVINTFIS